MKNNNTVKSTENDNIVLSTENDDIIKLINYNDFINTTSEFFTHMITSQSDLIKLINLSEFFSFALINSFNFSSSIKNKFELNDNQFMHELEFMS